MKYWPGTKIPKSENNAFTWRVSQPSEKPVAIRQQVYKPGKPITLNEKM